jgi:hypothetical protein
LGESSAHPDATREDRPVLLAGHLRGRLGHLREAIRLARECDGVSGIR